MSTPSSKAVALLAVLALSPPLLAVELAPGDVPSHPAADAEWLFIDDMRDGTVKAGTALAAGVVGVRRNREAVENSGYAASLELRKIYRRLADVKAGSSEFVKEHEIHEPRRACYVASSSRSSSPE